jgi:hydrogenase nickel incorporation protein HypA/HybF
MHELSICSSIAAIVSEHAAGRPVERVVLDVGYLRQVVPDTLMYSWELIVAGTPLERAVLVVNHIRAVIECRSCGAATTIELPVFRCPCGSIDIEVTAGEELLVRSLDITDITDITGRAQSSEAGA